MSGTERLVTAQAGKGGRSMPGTGSPTSAAVVHSHADVRSHHDAFACWHQPWPHHRMARQRPQQEQNSRDCLDVARRTGHLMDGWGVTLEASNHRTAGEPSGTSAGFKGFGGGEGSPTLGRRPPKRYSRQEHACAGSRFFNPGPLSSPRGDMSAIAMWTPHLAPRGPLPAPLVGLA
jgi:hypothetical protein